jgi:TrmH family RNA methyltransferase
MSELISSSTNPLIKLIRSLGQKKGREESGLFLVEGIHPVGEAVAAGWPIETLVYAPGMLTSNFAIHLLDEQKSRSDVRCVALSPQLFASVSGKDNPQGILGILHQQPFSINNLASNTYHWGVALVSPQDPGNVGTILRTLDAVGADGLFLLDGGVELYHPSVVRASMGTLFWKPVIQVSYNEFLDWKRKNGVRLIGSSAHPGIDYREFDWGSTPRILMMGNEQKGLSSRQIANCDEIVSMPMNGRASSLNLAVAAGVLLYQMMEKK